MNTALMVIDLVLHFTVTAWGVYAGMWAWEYVHQNDECDGKEGDGHGESTD